MSGHRQCWICFAEEPADSVDETHWVRPCKCRGTTRWVHQSCLLSWLSSREDGSLLAPRATCPQCHTVYRINEQRVMPRWMLGALDRAEELAEQVILYVSVGGLAASTYLLSWSYGAATLVAVLGRESDSVQRLLLLPTTGGQMDVLTSLRFAMGVPMIPLYVLSLRHPTLAWLHPFIPALVYGGPESLRIFQWPPSRSTIATHLPFVAILYEEMVRRRLLPAIRRRLAPESEDEMRMKEEESPSGSIWDSLDTADEILEDQTLKISVVGTTGTLLLPFVSSAVGWLLFGRTRMDPLVRTIVGGAIVVGIRDTVRTVMWYQRVLAKSTRRVLDYK